MSGRSGYRWLVLLAGILWGCPWLVRAVWASDLEVKPALSVSETFDDNIFETATGRQSEFTTMVRPGAAVSYHAPRLSLDSNYVFEYRNYAKGTHDDEEINNLDLKSTAEILEHFLYLDLIDTLHRTTVNVSRDVASESLLTQQSNQNIATVSPYLLWRLGEKGTLKTGYRYIDTRYWQGVGIDQRQNGAFADFQQQLSEKFTVSLDYAFTRGDSAQVDYNRHDLSGGFKYSYADRCVIFGSIGNSWQDFSSGTRTSNLFWDAGITHDFGAVVALLETKVQNPADPLSVSTRQVTYTGRLDKQLQRGALSLLATYSEYFITQTDQLEQKRLNVTGSGSYEILPKLSASASASLDRFSQQTSADLPYRLTGSVGFNYGFHNKDTALSLVYTYFTDRYDLDSATGERVSNRLVLEVRTLF